MERKADYFLEQHSIKLPVTCVPMKPAAISNRYWEVWLSRLRKEPVFFQGKQYDNFVVLCAEYQIQPGNVYDRLRQGFTLKDALTRPIRDMGRRNYVYYDGKEYVSFRDLCRDYGISEQCVKEQTRRNPIQFLEAIELLVRLKEQAGIRREEYLNYIPGCRMRGKSYKTVAVFAAEFGLTATALYSYKSKRVVCAARENP